MTSIHKQRIISMRTHESLLVLKAKLLTNRAQRLCDQEGALLYLSEHVVGLSRSVRVKAAEMRRQTQIVRQAARLNREAAHKRRIHV